MPENLHLLGTTEGSTDVCIQRGKSASYHDIVLPEVLDYLLCGMAGVHHHKIGVRTDRFKLTIRGLIKEFLTIVHFCSTEPFNPSLSGASSLSNDCIDSYYRLLRLPVPSSVTHLTLALPYLQGELKMRSRSKVFDPLFCNSFKASFRLACASRRLSYDLVRHRNGWRRSDLQ